MYKYKVNGQTVVCNLDNEEMARRLAQASGLMKNEAGLVGNAAWAVALEALDHCREHPRYRQRVKQAFKQVTEAFRAHEREMVYRAEDNLFRMSDWSDEHRKRYGAISDREYYDYWASAGATMTHRTHPWVTNLWNKFRLSFIGHKAPHADIAAWAQTADACLRLAEAVHENCIKVCVADHGIPEPLLRAIFDQLSLKDIADRWERACKMLFADDYAYDLTELEQRNIQLGVDQLMERWTDINVIADSLQETAAAYDEVFRTPGEQKKAVRQYKEMKD